MAPIGSYRNGVYYEIRLPRYEIYVVSYCPSQFYPGECWSGPEAGETYNRAGSSDQCVTKGYKECDPNDKEECVGDKNVNFVYEIDVTGTRVKFH